MGAKLEIRETRYPGPAVCSEFKQHSSMAAEILLTTSEPAHVITPERETDPVAPHDGL